MNWTRSQLKQMARTALQGSYWKSVLVAFLLSLTAASFASSGAASSENISDYSTTIDKFMPIIMISVFFAGSVGLALRIFLFRPLEVGCRKYFMEDIYYPAELDTLKAGFSGNYWNVVWILFCRDIFIVLWTFLFIIPGIIKSYEYKMIPYILAENPNISRQEAFALSKKMMYGDKLNAFVLELSFIGWALLTMVTFGLVGIFYYQPYLALTDAALYQALKEKIGGYNSGGYNNGGYDNGGYNNGGYNNGGYDNGGYNGGYNNGGYDNGGYNNGGYNNGGYDNGGYNNGGYDNGDYNNGGYNNGGYNNGVYDNGGYNNDGYDNGGYNNGGYDNGGYDNGGYNNGGYNTGGYANDDYKNQSYTGSTYENSSNMAPGNNAPSDSVSHSSGDGTLAVTDDSHSVSSDTWETKRNPWAEDGRQDNPWKEE